MKLRFLHFWICPHLLLRSLLAVGLVITVLLLNACCGTRGAVRGANDVNLRQMCVFLDKEQMILMHLVDIESSNREFMRALESADAARQDTLTVLTQYDRELQRAGIDLEDRIEELERMVVEAHEMNRLLKKPYNQ